MGKIRKDGFNRLGKQTSPDFYKKGCNQPMGQPGKEKRKGGGTGSFKKGDRLKEDGKTGKGDEKTDQNEIFLCRCANTAGGHL